MKIVFTSTKGLGTTTCEDVERCVLDIHASPRQWHVVWDNGQKRVFDCTLWLLLRIEK